MNFAFFLCLSVKVFCECLKAWWTVDTSEQSMNVLSEIPIFPLICKVSPLKDSMVYISLEGNRRGGNLTSLARRK